MHDSYSKLIYLSSAQRDSGTSSNFSISWGTEISMDAIKVVSVTMPNTFYNITTTNNKLISTEGVDREEVSITPGLYNINSLLTALAAALTANATLTGTYTAAVDPTTQLITLTSTVAFVIDTTTLAAQLGFTSTPTSSATSHVADELYDISSVRQVFLQVTGIPVTSIFNSGFRNILCTVPLVNAEFGQIIHQTYDSDANMITFTDTQFVDTLGFSLVDETGAPVDNNGVEWNIELAYMRRPQQGEVGQSPGGAVRHTNFYM